MVGGGGGMRPIRIGINSSITYGVFYIIKLILHISLLFWQSKTIKTVYVLFICY